jgi:PAS domain S-box-containing protein/putative nucleotidyltransferase with HDIG domain
MKKNSKEMLEISDDSSREELKDIVDIKEIQSLMDYFYALTNMGGAIIDLNGNILAGAGWQDICTKFHRINKDSCKNCIESDFYLTQNIKSDEYSLYKCKNNMWDVATPIIVEGKHIGNLFFGQFFFEDEIPDYKMFEAQAEKFGFDKKKYFAALKLVPRWSRDKIKDLMEFYSRFAKLISDLGYKNLKLARSLSEYKLAECALRKSEHLLSKIFDILPVGLCITDKNGKIVNSNQKCKEIWGIETLAGLNQYSTFKAWRTDGKKVTPKDWALNYTINSGKTTLNEILEIESFDGKRKTVINSTAPVLDEDGKVEAGIIVNVDITEQNKAKNLIEESEIKYRRIFETSPVGIATMDMHGIITSCNNTILKYGGLLHNQVMGKHFSKLGIFKIKDAPQILEIFNEILEGKKIKPFNMTWYSNNGNEATGEIYPSIIAEDNKTMGIQIIIRDITHEVKAEKDLFESYRKIQKTLEGSINTLSSILELNDPYTGGHQKNVAKLCAAIAQELGMDKEKIDALYTSALIHDIGKITIPASILSKPTELTNIEMSMIQTHSQTGFDILNKIDFGYPLADIILQHHERLNGSGYPNKLKDKNILFEAKILAIADTVEAMANHRPYRPAFGIAKALKEIETNKGILFDPSAVDACIKIFKNKKFKF